MDTLQAPEFDLPRTVLPWAYEGIRAAWKKSRKVEW